MDDGIYENRWRISNEKSLGQNFLYRCLVTTPSNATLTSFKTLAVPAGITATDEEVRVAKGNDVLLPCPYVGIPLAEIQWKKNDEIVEKNSV